ncbi:MAG: PEP-CTERM sorting domain-containing protein [Sedimentisphaerales bacterium]
MRKCVVAFILVVAISFLNNPAHGSLVSYYSDEVSEWATFDVVSSLHISEIASVEPTMNAEGSLIFTLTTTVTNQSDIIWTGYVLTLDPTGAATFVEGTAGSTKFGTVVHPDPWTVEFWQPEPVLPGQVVTLQFDINVSGPPPHIFTLSQNPIPEPATAVLLGLGVLALLLRPKRAIAPSSRSGLCLTK